MDAASKQRRNNYLPLVYFRGVKISQVLSILDFMYFGQVNIEPAELPSFLNFAEDLEIKGISLPDKNNRTENQKDVYAPLSNSSSQLLESHSLSSNLLQSSDLISCPSYEEINKIPKPKLLKSSLLETGKIS